MTKANQARLVGLIVLAAVVGPLVAIFSGSWSRSVGDSVRYAVAKKGRIPEIRHEFAIREFPATLIDKNKPSCEKKMVIAKDECEIYRPDPCMRSCIYACKPVVEKSK